MKDKAIHKLFGARLAAQSDVMPILQELGPYGILLLAGYFAAKGAYDLAQKLREYSFPENNIPLDKGGIVSDPRITQLPVVPLGTDTVQNPSLTVAPARPTFTADEIERIKDAINYIGVPSRSGVMYSKAEQELEKFGGIVYRLSGNPDPPPPDMCDRLRWIKLRVEKINIKPAFIENPVSPAGVTPDGYYALRGLLLDKINMLQEKYGCTDINDGGNDDGLPF